MGEIPKKGFNVCLSLHLFYLSFYFSIVYNLSISVICLLDNSAYYYILSFYHFSYFIDCFTSVDIFLSLLFIS